MRAITMSVLLADSQSHGLSHHIRLGRLEVGSNDRVATFESQRTPATEFLAVDKEHGGTTGFLTG